MREAKLNEMIKSTGERTTYNGISKQTKGYKTLDQSIDDAYELYREGIVHDWQY